MFYSLNGKIVYKDAVSAAIECGGIAFNLTASFNTLRKIGSKGDSALLYTYLSVREDAVELFGFADQSELELFKMLISVSGVGPKAAIAILSEFEPDALAVCITSGDSKRLTKAQGIGPKIAQRVILELKEKMSKRVPAEMDASSYRNSPVAEVLGNKSEAISALTALGYTRTDAASALSREDPASSVENLIKAGLRNLSRGI